MTQQPTSPAPRVLTGGQKRTSRRAISGHLLGRLLTALVQRGERARSRRLFATLNDRMLRDIGIDCAPTESGGTPWFWRLR